ncbi:MAG: hypothetical protein HY693_00805 [Deltaproteobacteria bacterium]|nr:hypothetical protein [Deltaproteobacteria bacterium]
MFQTVRTFTTEEHFNFTEVGDAESSHVTRFPDAASYGWYKQMFGNNKHLIVRQLSRYLSKYLLEIDEPEYDDANRELNINLKVRGFAVCKQGRWEVSVPEGLRLVSGDAAKWIFSCTTTTPIGVLSGHTYLQFSEKAKDITFDKAKNLIRYKLSENYEKGDELEDYIKAREALMPCLYKIYGDPKLGFGNYWVAKTVLRNTSKGKIEDIEIRYRIREYSDWSVPNSYSFLPPEGTIVDLYYPQLSQKVAELTSKTPVYLEIEYSYSGTKQKNVQKAESIHIRGKNEFEHSDITLEEAESWFDNFANTPLLAAFVTKADPAVRKFVDLVSRYSGGVAAARSDEEAIAWLKALYDLEVANGFNYQTPPGLLEEVLVQEIKYPRDVLSGKAGTCIDLAILYAACAEATDIKSYLIAIPGHCFPVFELPKNHQPFPVEATGINGLSFEDACRAAQQTFQKAWQEGKVIPTNIEEMWRQGVSPPELPPVPEDCLEKWHIRMPDNASAPQIPLLGIKSSTIQSPSTTTLPSVAGFWVGTVHNTTVGGIARIELQLQQSGSGVFGYFTVHPPLVGSGQLQGTIYGNSIQLEANTFWAQYSFGATINGNHIEGTYSVSSGFLGMQQGIIRADRTSKSPT